MILPEERLHQARVLIVDDNPVNVSLLEDILAAEGFMNVTGITEPERALAFLDRQTVDLVLLDIRMPVIDGHEFMNRLATKGDFYTPVIVLTAQTDAQTRMRALSGGARDFLTKPFDMTEVLLRIRNTLEAQLLFSDRRSQAEELEILVAERTRELSYLASHDPITGLPNRTALRLSITQHACCESGSLLFLDVEGMSVVTDALGHAMAEKALRAVGEALSECVTDSAILGSWGGSEFVIAGACPPDVLAAAAASVFATPIACDGHELVLDCRMGSVRFPEDGTDAEQLVQRAGLAMLNAVRSGQVHAPFAAALEEAAARRHTLEGELRHAVERNQFVVYYQPKLSLETEQVIGMEALLRWIHPTMGFVSPGHFIPVAEDTGAIVGIGEWVLEQACRDAVRWRDEGLADLKVAVNVSGRQFEAPDLPGTIRRALETSGLGPEGLEVEITESALMRDVGQAQMILQAIRDTGVTIALDDFGTGYSSLAYLRRFPVDVLKVDQSFVRDLTANPDDQAIVRTILAMAESLGMKTVAEGIETVDDARYLRSLGCLMGQGFFYAKPMPAAAFEEYLKERRTAQMVAQ